MKRKWFDENGNRLPCQFGDCQRPIAYSGMCAAHHESKKRYGEARDSSLRLHVINGVRQDCEYDGCGRPAISKGFCNTHYLQIWRGDNQTPIGKVIPCPVHACELTMGYRAALCKKHRQVAWRYSLSTERLIAMYAGAVCSNAVCGNTADLHIDHDHTCCAKDAFGTSHKVSCGECVRGLLCRTCNFALGQVGDSIAKMRGLIEYLENAKPAVAS